MEEIEELNAEHEDEVSDASTESNKKIGSRKCGGFCSLLSCVARSFSKCKKRQKRREDIEISQSPQNGLTIRMLRDQKASPELVSGEREPPRFDTLEVSLESSSEVSSIIRSPAAPRETFREEDEESGGHASASIFVPRVSSFCGGQDAEERLLSRAVGRISTSASTRPRFLTLHRRRRRRPPTRGLVREGAILDDLYNGPTQCVLKGVSFWDFNAFVLDSVCGGRPVTFLCVFLLHEYNLLSLFSLDAVTVWKCFSLIEEGYHTSNPYHNAIHAADVTQAMHCYLQEKVIGKYLTPFEKLAAIIASVCHDLDHPGVNQPFLIATDNHLAALYNNASVLENHHWRCAMGCLWESGILDKWSPGQVEDLQEMIRSLILATDITRQTEFLVRFRRYQDTGTLDLTNAECRHFCLQIALKCADICNPCRPWETSRQWSQKICDEFYRQGDYERQLRLPVTSMCDRYTNSVANIQAGFIKFVVAPLFESWDRWLNTSLSNRMLNNLQTNLQRWEVALKEEGVQDAKRSSVAEKLELEESGAQQHSDGSTTSSGEVSEREREVACPILGRRHSLPLNMPSLLPRTVIRRESLTGEGGAPPLVFETLKMGESVVDSVVTVGVSGEQPFFPSPSIATMGEMGKPRRMSPHTARVQQRRQSLPPLWDSSFIPSRLPLQALPPTPLQEELPPVEMEAKEEQEEEKVPLLKKNGCGSGSTSVSSGKNGGNGKDCGEGSSSHKQVSSERRSSITRNLPPLDLHEEVDKENVAPTGDRIERPLHNILKTRVWRSLNQEDEMELQVVRGSKGMYKQQNYRMGRRGSAPLLKPEEPRAGNIRSGYDRPLHELPKRRGSAPSNQLTSILGSDALALLSEERIMQLSNPLLAKENALQSGDKNLFGSLVPGSRSGQRRGSMPWECHKTDYHTFISSNSVKVENFSNMPFSEGAGLPSGFMSSDAQGTSGGGGGVTPSSLEYRRGSAGYELMSGLWRLRLERQGSSQCSDESVGISSSGGGTPGTPGVPGGLNPALYQGHPLMPGPILRRGSLPTDVIIGGDFDRWSGMDPS